MRWGQQSRACRSYLWAIYLTSVPVALYSFYQPSRFEPEWLLLTLTSLFVATITVRLPKISSVISMGDVFIILSLLHFGPGPALVTYWVSITTAHLSDVFKKHGTRIKGKILLHRFFFNLSCCALCLASMQAAYGWVQSFGLNGALTLLLSLVSIALSWFIVNTTTLSLAISFWMNQPFWSVWREGLNLYLLNFLGSAAAAGLVSSFYDRVGSQIFLLSVPLAVVLYQLYGFYIAKFEQAQQHIKDLNKLYLQTIEAMATAVDAKDPYTHGHIRRVQVYATKLAECLGVNDENELMALRAGALLHDIGKIAIPEYILNKPAALTESEYDKMKLHPVVGANMLKSIDFPYPVIPLVRSHHERWDGKGYPEGLAGAEIPIGARILSLVDCYDALTTNRPYRSPMQRNEIVEFFGREAGKAYDPSIVHTFVSNLALLEEAGQQVVLPDGDIWGIREGLKKETPTLRPLENVQPIVTYGKAMSSDSITQQNLYAVFEFARADIQCLTSHDVLLFMGSKLSALIEFDAAAFYIADLQGGSVVAQHVLGSEANTLRDLRLPLEQKLSGWAAANNQSLCNLPPFPDFINCSDDDRPSFELSAIAPMNRHGSVLGAVSLYRNERKKFSEEEFRKLELVASQTALALAKCVATDKDGALFDHLTGLPNGYQLYLMFDQIAADALKFDYELAVLTIRMDDLNRLRLRWGHIVGDEAVRSVAKYLIKELRDTDLLVRYAGDEFVTIVPRLDRDHAEGLKSRLQDELDHFKFLVRPGLYVPLPVSIGIAMFPQDGLELENLLTTSEWHTREDAELRTAARHGLKNQPTHF